jgi:tetratricopeptide (TPR) repeat protein
VEGELEKAEKFRTQGNITQANAILGKLIHKKPKDFRAYLERGANFAKVKNYKKAIHDYKKVINIDPSNQLAHYNLGLNYMRLDYYDSAENIFNQIINLKGGGPIFTENVANGFSDQDYSYNVTAKEVLYQRACAYFDQEKFQLAYKDFTASINNYYKLSYSYYYRGYCLLQLNNFNLGCNDLRKAKNLGMLNIENEIIKYCN